MDLADGSSTFDLTGNGQGYYISVIDGSEGEIWIVSQSCNYNKNFHEEQLRNWFIVQTRFSQEFFCSKKIVMSDLMD